MADAVTRPWTLPLPGEAVAASASSRYWYVDAGTAPAGAWAVPAELAALLAPTVVVGAGPRSADRPPVASMS